MEDTLTFAEFHKRFVELVEWDGSQSSIRSNEEVVTTWKKYSDLRYCHVDFYKGNPNIQAREDAQTIQELKDEIAELKADIECYKAMDRI